MSNVTYEQAVRSREKANRMRKRNFRVLECSIRGYKPCSPLIAKVTVFGKTFTIEEWYQKSKGVNGAFVDPDRNPYMMRGITPDFYEINRKRLGIKKLKNYEKPKKTSYPKSKYKPLKGSYPGEFVKINIKYVPVTISVWESRRRVIPKWNRLQRLPAAMSLL